MLTLAEDGIFPIVRDAEGRTLPQLPASGFDFPGTVQGEGKLNGIPSLFIRLAGCNLHCCWKTADGSVSECDTAYASYRVKRTLVLSEDEICRIVRHNTENLHHLVITGGEPFLQADALTGLCRKLKQMKPFHITVETNATLFHAPLAAYIDFFSLSPKLSSSSPVMPYAVNHNRLRLQPEVIQQFIEHARLTHKDFQLKFVCATREDVVEIKQFLAGIRHWKNEDILLMPAGANCADLKKNTEDVVKYCIQNGWRYCDRLHLSLFGEKAGV